MNLVEQKKKINNKEIVKRLGVSAASVSEMDV